MSKATEEKMPDRKYLEFLRCAEKNPGVCQCNIRRCPSCGYTEHDKMYWMDHSYCDSRKKRLISKTW